MHAGILYTYSPDGKEWASAVELFPSMAAALYNATNEKVHLVGSPYVTLNGRLYALANVGGHMKCTIDGYPVGGDNQLEIYPANAFQLTYTLIRAITFKTAEVSSAEPSKITPELGPIYWVGKVPCGMGTC